MSDNHLVILDLETTGLEPNEPGAAILEVGALVIDAELRVAAEFNEVLDFRGSISSDFVWDMHVKNGLLKECREVASWRFGLRAVQKDVIDFLTQHTDKSVQPTLIGNSVHFDRKWLEFFMPDLASRFHYRQLDVSSVGLLAQNWLPEVFESRPQAKAHRALPDCYDTLAQLKHYVKCWRG